MIYEEKIYRFQDQWMKCLYQEGHLLLHWVKEGRLLTPLPSSQDDVSKMGPLCVVMMAGNQGANEERGTSWYLFLPRPCQHTQSNSPLKLNGLFVCMFEFIFFESNAKTLFCW